MSQGCRFCEAPLQHVVVDLGLSPLSNALLTEDQLKQREPQFPLRPLVCERCWLMQLPELATPESIFSNYVYFSSYSTSWIKHVAEYAEDMIQRLQLDERSLVAEVGSNDGHLLSCFSRRNIPVVGIEPAANLAAVAQRNGIRTEVAFFGARTAAQICSRYGKAKLIVGNNVLAHVPDINDFVAGLRMLLDRGGTITMEFPHLLSLLEQNEFDTIYHEHFSYFSLAVVRRIFAAHGLKVVDADLLPTHGGSLRIQAVQIADAREDSVSLAAIEAAEETAALETLGTYERFARNVAKAKEALLGFLQSTRARRMCIAGYGAPAKATTLLAYCGVDSSLLPYTVDRNPVKQGKYIPGARIRIEPPSKIAQQKPDYVLILPWNWAQEIIQQMGGIREWGGKFVVPIPTAAVLT